VFCTIGTTANALNVVNRHFKPLLKCAGLRDAGLRDIRWHDLRHTCATLLLGRRVHSKLAQHLLHLLGRAFPVGSEWYQDEQQIQSDCGSNGTPSRASEPQSADTCF